MTTGTVPRPRRTRVEAREDNRRALLEAAGQLVVERGYLATGLLEIAERAGVTTGAIYSIFGSKLGLLRALAEEHAARFAVLPGFADLDEVTPVEDILTALAHGYLDLVTQPDSLRMLAFELELSTLALRDPTTLEEVQSRERAQTDHVASVLTGRRRRRGRPLTSSQAADVADLALALLGGVGQRVAMLPGATHDPAAVAAALLRLLP